MFRNVDDPLKRGLEEARLRAEKARKDLDFERDFDLGGEPSRFELYERLVSILAYERNRRAMLDSDGETSASAETVDQDGYFEDPELEALAEEAVKQSFLYRALHWLIWSLLCYLLIYQVVAFLAVKTAKVNNRMAFDYESLSKDLLEENEKVEEYIQSKYSDAKKSEPREYKDVIDSSFLPWIKYISNGKDALAYRVGLIENAKKSVDLMVYDFELDETTAILLESMKRAAERGVEVRVLIDGFASFFHSKFSYPFSRFASLSNVYVKVYNPISTIPSSTHFRLHSKMMIVDDEYLLIGGRNLSDKFLHLDSEDRTGNNDLDLLLRFPKVNTEVYDILAEDETLDNIANDLALNQVDMNSLKKKVSTHISDEIKDRKSNKDYAQDDGEGDDLLANNQEFFEDLVLDNTLSFAKSKLYFDSIFFSKEAPYFHSSALRKYFDDFLYDKRERLRLLRSYNFLSNQMDLENNRLSEEALIQGMVPSENLFFLNNGIKPGPKFTNMLNMLFTLFKVNEQSQVNEGNQVIQTKLDGAEGRNNSGSNYVNNYGTNSESLLAHEVKKGKNILFTPYIVLSKDIEDKIREYDLGDKLEIVTNSPSISPNPFTSSDFIQHKDQLETIFPNIKLIETTPPIHTKVSLVSDNLAVISSMNLDTRSIKINAEIMMLVKGKLAQSTLLENLSDDYGRAREISTVDIEKDKKWYQILISLLTFLRDLY